MAFTIHLHFHMPFFINQCDGMVSILNLGTVNQLNHYDRHKTIKMYTHGTFSDRNVSLHATDYRRFTESTYFNYW